MPKSALRIDMFTDRKEYQKDVTVLTSTVCYMDVKNTSKKRLMFNESKTKKVEKEVFLASHEKDVSKRRLRTF